jgi:hypothetical protein
MFKNPYLSLIILASAIVGCGGAPAAGPVAKSAHGGTLVTLPDGQGLAEVLVESAAAGRGGRKAKAQAGTKIVAYFLQSDGMDAMSPGPTQTRIKIGMGDKGRVIDLAAEPKEVGKYASAIGLYPDGFVGQLEATLNGRAVQVPIRIR